MFSIVFLSFARKLSPYLVVYIRFLGCGDAEVRKVRKARKVRMFGKSEGSAGLEGSDGSRAAGVEKEEAR